MALPFDSRVGQNLAGIWVLVIVFSPCPEKMAKPSGHTQWASPASVNLNFRE